MLRFDADAQAHAGSGAVVAHNVTAAAPWARVDMTSAYGGAANVSRTFSLLGGGPCAAARTVDAWVAPRDAVNATWNMMTTAAVDVSGGGALLSVGAARLRLDASGVGAARVTWSAARFEPPPPQEASSVDGLPLWVVTATTPAGGPGGAGLTVTMTPGPC